MMPFWKYHGLGNDFVVLQDTAPDSNLASRLCDRHFGVGADGVLFVSFEGPHARMIIVNQDGSRPQMCGNGIRCVARFLAENHQAGDTVDIQTDAGTKTCQINRLDWTVRVNMGPARRDGHIDYEGHRWMAVNMGNPHVVTFLDDMPDLAEIDRIGTLANLDRSTFPEGVNLEFVVVRGDFLEVVVFERGVGRTLACGTGACAAAVAAFDQDVLQAPARVRLPGGILTIEQDPRTIWMTGGATLVYQGALSPDWFGLP